ncbi:MAG TPA: hypothetical protein VK612_00770 [Pyrinomonadaceae bacterium]|nr:hypothetical protein [Pyrinomonadaceae bacterium]
MQTDTAQSIFQKIPMLSEDQQQEILEMTESFLSEDSAQKASIKLKEAVADAHLEADFA